MNQGRIFVRPFFWDLGMKKEKKEMKQTGLQAFLDEAEKLRLQEDIVEIKKPRLETERVLVGESPKLVHEIIRHVQDCQQIFVTAEHPDLAPTIPPEFDVFFEFPTERTAPRERAYFLDRDGYMREIMCEVRQEAWHGGYKQTTKLGKGGTRYDPTMDRMEQRSKTCGFGFNVYAIGDEDAQVSILRNASSLVKPVLRMVSQRTRIPYHPEGNPNIEIEMALEPIHFGETFTGYKWFVPKIDLEIKIVPENYTTAMRHSLMAREEERIMSIFPLKRQLKSSPTPGFDEISNSMQNAAIRQRFDTMAVDEKWWISPKQKFDLVA